MIQAGSAKPVKVVAGETRVSGAALPVYGFTPGTLNRQVQGAHLST